MPRRRTPTIEDYVGAILDRHEGVPYPQVLDRYRITPVQFFRAVRQKLRDFLQTTTGHDRQTLKEITKRPLHLFNMGEEFVREQYDRVRAGRQIRFYEGTLQHPENIKHIVYYALTSNNPQLASTDRKEVIRAIRNLPTKLQRYFNSLGLAGLMATAFEKGKMASPLAVLEVFDRVYQRKTGNPSLFDKTQDDYLFDRKSRLIRSKPQLI